MRTSCLILAALLVGSCGGTGPDSLTVTWSGPFGRQVYADVSATVGYGPAGDTLDVRYSYAGSPDVSDDELSVAVDLQLAPGALGSPGDIDFAGAMQITGGGSAAEHDAYTPTSSADEVHGVRIFYRSGGGVFGDYTATVTGVIHLDRVTPTEVAGTFHIHVDGQVPFTGSLATTVDFDATFDIAR